MQVVWGLISMVDAEKRLLANALEDVDNQVFVLLSDRFGPWLRWLPFWSFVLNYWVIFALFHSCVPLHSFDYVYNYLMGTNVSFVDWWEHYKLIFQNPFEKIGYENFFFSLEDVHIHSLWFFVLPLFSTYKFQGSRSTWQWKVLSWDVSWNRREGF